MKKIIVIFLLIAICLAFVGCNYQMVDTTYNYDYAIIMRADGEQRIDIAKWRDYEDGEQIQIVDTNGNIWLVNSFYTILVKEAK